MRKIASQLVLFAVLAFGVGACVGVAARDQALVPAAQSTWPQVRKDIERGLQEVVDAQKPDVTLMINLLDAAITSGNRAEITGLVSSWEILKEVAFRGIERRISDGEIGAGVGASYFERLSQFDQAIKLMGGV